MRRIVPDLIHIYPYSSMRVASLRINSRMMVTALWIDESLITLCQRVRFQRGRTKFFIILVPMNGPLPRGMTAAAHVLPCDSRASSVISAQFSIQPMMHRIIPSIHASHLCPVVSSFRGE